MRPSAELAELARLQRGLQALITAPGPRERVDARAAREIGCAPEPVRVYRRMVALRLARELAREFPATRALLGATRFERAARAFVDSHPSRSYTLEGYGRSFPEALRQIAPGAPEAPALARLEREIGAVRTARSVASRRHAALPEGAVPRMAPAPGARVLAFSHDVATAYAAFERGATPPRPRRRSTHLALFRRGPAVARLRVSRREATMLRALLRRESLEEAVRRGVRAGLAPGSIRRAFERWVARGLLRELGCASAEPDVRAMASGGRSEPEGMLVREPLR